MPHHGITSFEGGGRVTELKTRPLPPFTYDFSGCFPLCGEGGLLLCSGVVSVAKLNDKQKRFVDEYLVDLNATAAAKRAGYSEKSASRIAIELLNKTHVSAEIQKRQAKLRGKLEITQERVLEELAAIAFANGTDFATITRNGLVRLTPTDEVPEEKKKAVASIKEGQYGTEIKLHDKVRALELLGKHLGVFDTNNGSANEQENNIFEVIEESTREEIGTDEIPEIEPPAKPGHDLVE